MDKVTSDPSTPRLRVLCLSRLFGGLKSGLAAGKWEPAGVPAIYRLLEGLAADDEIELLTVFGAKEPDARFRHVFRHTIAGIGETVILPYRTLFGLGPSRANAALTELESAARILAIAARFRPHIVYVTYANLLPAALLARLGHRGVVLRFMGVVPHHREIAAGALPLFRWQLQSPFARAVCTEDGSDPAAVLPKILSPRTPITVRLNGCDMTALGDQERDAIRTVNNHIGRPVVVFVGRLEPYKGCLEFVDAALAVLKGTPDRADFVLVGDGPLRAEMEARVRGAGQSARVRFVGSLPHDQVRNYLGAADIYVSTNMYGNLSNANLEALAAGLCLVLPTSDPAIPLDTVTDNLLPTDIALRYDRTRLPQSLAEALSSLLASPPEIASRRSKTVVLAKRMIKPWAQTIAEDIGLLKSIAQRNVLPTAAPLRT